MITDMVFSAFEIMLIGGIFSIAFAVLAFLILFEMVPNRARITSNLLCVFLMLVSGSIILLVLTRFWAVPGIVQDRSTKFVDDFNKSKVYYEIIYESGKLDTFSEKVNYDDTVGEYNSELEKALQMKTEVFTENMDPRIYDLEPIKTFE